MAVLKFLSSLFKSKKDMQPNKTKNYKKKTPRISKKSKIKKIIPKKTKSISKIKKTEKEIGTITHYFGKISVGIIKLKNKLCLGDEIHIRGKHTDFSQKITSMQLNHRDITEAKKGWEIGIKVIQRVRENDKVYKVVET